MTETVRFDEVWGKSNNTRIGLPQSFKIPISSIDPTQPIIIDVTVSISHAKGSACASLFQIEPNRNPSLTIQISGNEIFNEKGPTVRFNEDISDIISNNTRGDITFIISGSGCFDNAGFSRVRFKGSVNFTKRPVVTQTNIQIQAEKTAIIEPDFKDINITGNIQIINGSQDILEYETNIGLTGIINPSSVLDEPIQTDLDVDKIEVGLKLVNDTTNFKEKSFTIPTTITDNSERGKFNGIKSYITLNGSSVILTNRLFFTIDNSKSDFEATNEVFFKFINSKRETFVTPPRTVNKYYVEITDIDELLTIQSISGSYRVSGTNIAGSFTEDQNLSQSEPPELGPNPIESSQKGGTEEPTPEPQPEPEEPVQEEGGIGTGTLLGIASIVVGILKFR